MKILQVITLSDLGGAQSVVIELSNALIKKDHEVLVMSSRSGHLWDLLDKNIKQIKSSFFCREVNILKDLQSFFELKKIIKTEKPDVIHLHSSKVGVLGRLAAFPLFSKKTFYTVHGFDTILKANRIFLPLEKLLKKSCSRIIAVSNYDKENLCTHGITNVEVIYNAIADTKKRDESDQNIVNKISKCAHGRKIIMSIARVSKQKRFDSYKELAELLPEYCFLWIGNSEPMDGLPENMYCLGEIPHASSYINFSDVFVLLSNYEGLPVTIIESLSCGIPVIASHVGGIPEILDGASGFALENNIDFFKDKINAILSNSRAYNSLKKSARKQYECQFTIDIMVSAYEKVYKQSTY